MSTDADPGIGAGPSVDARMIASARSGDGRALAVLYQRFARPMLRVAYHLMGTVADAEDVLHDVFLGLPDALRRYEERGRFAAWLQRLTARTALNALRSTRRRRESAIGDAAAVTSRDDSGAVAASIDLERALLALPDPLRTVFVLRELEHYSHAEIAEMLGISTRASEIRLCRAFKRLRATSRRL